MVVLDVTDEHGHPVAEHVSGLVDGGGGGALVGREPLAGDEGRGRHDRHAAHAVQDGAGVAAVYCDRVLER